MIHLNTNIFVITLSIDELNAPGKRQSSDFKKRNYKLVIRDIS